MIKHGGQNPLEAARFGAKIFHGPNIDNFKDVYKLLKSLNISKKILIWSNPLEGILTIFELPASNEKINEKAKFIGTLDGATWNASPRPSLISISS